MIPVFIGHQIKKALRENAQTMAASDAVRVQMVEKVLKELRLDVKRGMKSCHSKRTVQDEGTLSIILESTIMKNIVISEDNHRWFLIVKKESEGQQLEFIIDTTKKINIVLN